MIAIHHSGQWSFRPEWEAYCRSRGIPYKLVNAYDSDIIRHLEGCSAFLFHHHHTSAKDILFAKALLNSVQQAGLNVFPDGNTGWHFDDKLGQKYLLEAIGAPLVPTHVFYSYEAAIRFLEKAKFPLVFKLRGGAGSNNVCLLHTLQEAKKTASQAFGSGFSNYNRWGDLRENLRRFLSGTSSFKDMAKSIRRVFTGTAFSRIAGKEAGYFLVQDFMPGNTFDIRIITIGRRAFGIKRLVRKDDFRASGSGFIEYDPQQIDIRCVDIAFETTRKLKAQCVAYDFVFDTRNEARIVEINYGFAHRSYDDCPGYWDDKLVFHPGKIDPCGWMIEGMLKN